MCRMYLILVHRPNLATMTAGTRAVVVAAREVRRRAETVVIIGEAATKVRRGPEIVQETHLLSPRSPGVKARESLPQQY